MHASHRILLTGANGQLGQEFVHFFKSHNQHLELKAFGSSEADITNEQQIRALFTDFKPTLLINCAAYTQVDLAESEEGFKKALAVNNVGVALLVKVCKEFKTKLVHFSTDYVFNGNIEGTSMYTEDSLPSPINKYGESKLLGDNEILASGIPYLNIRVAWLAGAYGWNFIRAVQKKIQTTTTLSIVDDQVSTPSFAHDVVEKTWELILRNETGLFNVASSTMVNRLDFAKQIVRNLGMADRIHFEVVKTADFKSAAQRPLKTPLSTKKLENVLGFPIKKWQVLLLESMNQMKEQANAH